jgi:hypothetical protein
MWRAFLIFLGVLAMANPAFATVYSPWILSEHVADTRDAARFAADPRWANLQGQEKALAVWRYLTDPVTGTWHYADTSEGSDPNWESRIVKDPIKDLNVYGYAVCTVHACMLEGLYEALGFGVRQMEFGGYHRTAEVEWDGSWHYLDVDERAYLIDASGRVVSVTEATTRPELWEPSASRVSPCYPENGGVKGIAELSKRAPGVPQWHWRTRGHTMDFTLRPGESLTRFWKRQGRWRSDPSWTGEQQLKALQTPPAGPKTSREISVNNSYGNGKWVYAPKLSPRYADFAEGVYRTHNVKLDAKGLRLATAGKGWAEWRVQTPYIIAGKPNNLADQTDDSDGAIAELTTSGGFALCVSIDQGRHWTQVWSDPKARGKQRVDLTKWVAGKYEYHLRLDLNGTPRNVRLSSLRLTTWTQLAPAALPRLKQGVNHLAFTWGDQLGEATEMLILAPELSDPADAKRWGVAVEGEYDPTSVNQRATGPVTLKVKALEGTKLRRLHIGGAFYTHRDRTAPVPDRILYSTNPSEGWRLLKQETPPEWVEHWYYNSEADLELNLPVKELWVRLVPAVAANGLRIYAHCAKDDTESRGPVLVTHTYRAGGKQLNRTFRFTAPRAYEITCPLEPENVSVKMAVPSRER